ncbi:MAG TPA: glycosyltransferase family 2 protein [Acidimicrobiales bacterium]|nr:glycosyltransferase family 2 protein [Acidimicrobiales bacterium]
MTTVAGDRQAAPSAITSPPGHHATRSDQVIDIVLPAHNEGDGIETTLREFYEVVTLQGRIPIRFVVCEDGSTDDTVEVLTDLADDIPLVLLSSPERKGYSRAVLDGFAATTSDVVAFIDSDGQCDPADFATLVRELGGADMVIGYRNPRNDAAYRKLMSFGFKTLYRRLFPVRLKDPSCPYLVLRRGALQAILRGSPGLLRQGFWWEFNARAAAAGVATKELPVRHRARLDGETKVYRPTRIPGIAYDHIRALFALRAELRQLSGVSEPAPVLVPAVAAAAAPSVAAE